MAKHDLPSDWGQRTDQEKLIYQDFMVDQRIFSRFGQAITINDLKTGLFGQEVRDRLRFRLLKPEIDSGRLQSPKTDDDFLFTA